MTDEQIIELAKRKMSMAEATILSEYQEEHIVSGLIEDTITTVIDRIEAVDVWGEDEYREWMELEYLVERAADEKVA